MGLSQDASKQAAVHRGQMADYLLPLDSLASPHMNCTSEEHRPTFNCNNASRDGIPPKLPLLHCCMQTSKCYLVLFQLIACFVETAQKDAQSHDTTPVC